MFGAVAKSICLSKRVVTHSHHPQNVSVITGLEVRDCYSREDMPAWLPGQRAQRNLHQMNSILFRMFAYIHITGNAE